MKNARVKAGLAGLMFVLSTTAAFAEGAPGARPGDKEMTCEDVAKEQAKINKDIKKSADAKNAGKKVGKGLLGFVKNVAQSTVPTAVSGLGGSSVVGAAAGRAASQEVGSAIYDAGRNTGNTAAEAKATPEQQARLDRLAKIGAYRQCPAA